LFSGRRRLFIEAGDNPQPPVAFPASWRLGEVEIDYKSVCTLYTLPGYSLRKSLMIRDPALVSSCRDLAGLIQRLAYGTASAHDIRLRFRVAGIYDVLRVLIPAPLSPGVAVADSEPAAPTSESAGNGVLHKRKRSKDLVLQKMPLDKEGLVGKVTVHHSDTVLVILACSEMPIRFDIGGLFKSWSAATAEMPSGA
jgi:hypothetical protein